MTTLGRRLSWFSVLAILTALPLPGYKPTQQERPAAKQIRVQTTEVVVDVSVTDSGGHPVQGLTTDDFEVYEDGVKQPILSSRFVSGDALNPGGQAPKPEIPSSDLVADTPSLPHLVSLVFDKINVERGE
jgi:hypothetical protein